jgi:phosphate transport system substrate-binding protein
MRLRNLVFSASRGKVLLWGLVALVGVTLIGTAAYTVLVLHRGVIPPFSGRENPGPGVPATQRVSCAKNHLEFAGSGSNLPITRALADLFQKHHPDARILVHESIGSSGAIRAVRDGVVPIGLISRAPKPEEKQGGMHFIPFARVAVVFAAHPSVPEDGLDEATILRIYRGEKQVWSDGSPIRVLQRERNDSSHMAVNHVWPEFQSANEEAYNKNLWPVLFSDTAMLYQLWLQPGSLGLTDLGALRSLRLPLKSLYGSGIDPGEEDLESGRYPFFKDLYFVVACKPQGAFADFLQWVFSDEGRGQMRSLGYVPLPGYAE